MKVIFHDHKWEKIRWLSHYILGCNNPNNKCIAITVVLTVASNTPTCYSVTKYCTFITVVSPVSSTLKNRCVHNRRNTSRCPMFAEWNHVDTIQCTFWLATIKTSHFLFFSHYLEQHHSSELNGRQVKTKKKWEEKNFFYTSCICGAGDEAL